MNPGIPAACGDAQRGSGLLHDANSASFSWLGVSAVDFPLAVFEQRIGTDPNVLGMILTGSLERDTGDRCSDIGVTLWLRHEALSQPGLIDHYVGLLGEVQLIVCVQARE